MGNGWDKWYNLIGNTVKMHEIHKYRLGKKRNILNFP
jgi:hypothetical protein